MLFYDQVVISEDAARAFFVRDNAAMALVELLDRPEGTGEAAGEEAKA